MVVEEESRKCEVKNSAFSVAVPPPVILEIGCGSGAIALSLLCKIPQVNFLTCPSYSKYHCERTVPLYFPSKFRQDLAATSAAAVFDNQALYVHSR